VASGVADVLADVMADLISFMLSPIRSALMRQGSWRQITTFARVHRIWHGRRRRSHFPEEWKACRR
jgi:hypothetical protein